MKDIEDFREQFTPILIHDILPDQILGFDVYLFMQVNNKYIKYIDNNSPIKEEQLKRLKFHRIKELFIKNRDLGKYSTYISASMRKKIEGCPEKEKSVFIKKAASDLIQTIDTVTNNNEDTVSWNNNCIELAKVVVDDLTEISYSKIIKKLEDFLSGKPTLITHSLSVSSLGVIISMSLGIYNEKILSEVAIGGLLHDVGMSRTSKAIIKKSLKGENFKPNEFELYKRHPQEGIKILGKMLEIAQITDNVLKIVLEHHELIDGSGFPKGISGDKISYLAKIITISDCLSKEMFKNKTTDFKYSILQLKKKQVQKNTLDLTILDKILTMK